MNKKVATKLRAGQVWEIKNGKTAPKEIVLGNWMRYGKDKIWWINVFDCSPAVAILRTEAWITRFYQLKKTDKKNKLNSSKLETLLEAAKLWADNHYGDIVGNIVKSDEDSDRLYEAVRAYYGETSNYFTDKQIREIREGRVKRFKTLK